MYIKKLATDFFRELHGTIFVLFLDLWRYKERRKGSTPNISAVQTIDNDRWWLSESRPSVWSKIYVAISWKDKKSNNLWIYGYNFILRMYIEIIIFNIFFHNLLDSARKDYEAYWISTFTGCENASLLVRFDLHVHEFVSKDLSKS